MKFGAFLLLSLCLGFSAHAGEFQKKLKAQFDRYDAAREVAIQKVGVEGKTVTRDEWEKLLKGEGDQEITAEDLEKLKRKQNRTIRINAELYKAISRIDLDSLRREPRAMKAFCAEMPKGGLLHVHPTGTADRTTVRSLLEQANPSMTFSTISKMVGNFFDPSSYEFLKSHNEAVAYGSLNDAEKNSTINLFFTRPGHHPFKEFTGLFIMNGLYKSPTSENQVYEDFLARAQREHVSYVEFTKDYAIDAQMLPKLEKWAADWKQRYGIEVHFNYSFKRDRKPEDNRKIAQDLVALPESDVLTGIDILADESNTPALEQGQTSYATVLAKVKSGQSHLHRTFHAGELGDVRNVRDALIFGAERIGHGVLMNNDPLALEYARRHHTGVEINLVSNYRLESVADLHQHPFLRYLRLGLRPSLSTDDEGMLETDINHECETAISVSDMSYAELKQLVMNSIETSFAKPATKKALLEQLDISFKSFEKNWSEALSF